MKFEHRTRYERGWPLLPCRNTDRVFVINGELSRVTDTEPFEKYRALRRLNPSPYMLFLDFDDLAGEEPLRLIGASPEMHALLEGRMASLRPIAGTRQCGETPHDGNARATGGNV